MTQEFISLQRARVHEMSGFLFCAKGMYGSNVMATKRNRCEHPASVLRDPRIGM